MTEEGENYEKNKKILEYKPKPLEKNKLELRSVNSILADYYKTPNQDYAARCQFRVHETNLIDLTLTVKTREQAQAICDNWKKQNEDVYAYLMDLLLK